ncbi:MAG: glycosyltransferase [Candidatus Promineifilaceae bacterium]
MNPPPLNIGVYTPIYLAATMTFIHRQLVGVRDPLRPIALTSNPLVNRDLFPLDSIIECKRTWAEKAVTRINYSLFANYKILPSRQRKFWANTIQQHDIRLLHVHFGHMGIKLLPLAKQFNLPLLVTFHGTDASTLLQRRQYRTDLKKLFAYATVIAVSDKIKSILIANGANPERVVRHYIGVPLDHFPFVTRSAPQQKMASGEQLTFLQVSRFVEKKGHEFTIQAFGKFTATYPNAVLHLIGDGPRQSEMVRLVEALGLTEKVRFFGRIDATDIPTHLAQADVLLQHSVTAANGDQEGLPITILEAMASGMPVISTHHAGIPEAIIDGQTGFLVNERDVAAYVDKLHALATVDQTMGEQAAARVRQLFDINTQNQALNDLYFQQLRINL